MAIYTEEELARLRGFGGLAAAGVRKEQGSFEELMTLRDWFAGEAMNAFILRPGMETAAQIAAAAGEQADEMLLERTIARGDAAKV